MAKFRFNFGAVSTFLKVSGHIALIGYNPNDKLKKENNSKTSEKIEDEKEETKKAEEVFKFNNDKKDPTKGNAMFK